MLVCDRNRVKHYWNPETDREFFSVSQVLGVMDPDKGKWIADEYREFGQRFHRHAANFLVQKDLTGEWPMEVVEDCGRVDPLMKNCLSALMAWTDEANVSIHDVEIKDHHNRLPYAGTVDLFCTWGRKKEKYLVDFKSGIPNWLDRIQVQAYGGIFRGYRLGILYVNKRDGTFKFVKVRHSYGDKARFYAAVQLLSFRTQRGM